MPNELILPDTFWASSATFVLLLYDVLLQVRRSYLGIPCRGDQLNMPAAAHATGRQRNCEKRTTEGSVCSSAAACACGAGEARELAPDRAGIALRRREIEPRRL